MALARGSHLGPFEVVARLGAGGMGEVFRARDSRLNRDVAIKALAPAVNSDPERIARFEREAQILAALKHPGIAGIYGVEEQDGARYLILEYVDGVSLADKLARGALPVDDALQIARQIADALEAAHEKGIIHRDLKPANVMLTPDGTVKVLDFGLGKALSSESSGPSDPMSSPTVTAATQLGVILGTAAYMSPEQAKGRPADKRSDVWAFGCVLFELLSGQRPFAGEDVSDTLAAVLRGDPDWSQLPATTPAPIVRLLERCLVKDRRQRLPDLSVARFELDDWIAGRHKPTTTAAPTPTPRTRTAVIAAIAAVGGAVVMWLVNGVIVAPAPAAAPRAPVARFTIDSPSGETMRARRQGPGIDIAASPDGSKLIYRVVGRDGLGDTLALHELSQSDSVLLSGTRGSINSFSISPAGDRLLFHADGKLQTITFGSRMINAIVDLASPPNGTDWVSNEVLVYAALDGALYRVKSSGGTPELLARPPASASASPVGYLYPEVVPGGDALLYVAGEGLRMRIEARRLDGTEPKLVVENATFPKVTATGHLLFVRGDGRLMAGRFDREALSLVGDPVSLDEVVGPLKDRGGSSFDVTHDGMFVSLVAEEATTRRFVWRSRDGKVLGYVGAQPLDRARYPRLSSDDRRLAATVGGHVQGQIWVFDLAGSTQPQKLTFDGHNVFPMWTPGDRHLLFMHTPPGGAHRVLHRLPADGSGLTAEQWQTLPGTTHGDLSPDGESLLYSEQHPETASDLIRLEPGSKDPPVPWLNERFHEVWPSFAPDGRWVAYVSYQTGDREVWIRPFPGPGAPIRVSSAGGVEPRWSRDGRELFYQKGTQMMGVRLTPVGTTLQLEPARVLFEGGFVQSQPALPRTYDVARDGRFLMMERPDAATVDDPGKITVVVGFDELIRQKLR